MDLKPWGSIASEGCRQRRKNFRECTLGKGVGNGTCPGGNIAFQRMGENVVAGIGNKAFGQTMQQLPAGITRNLMNPEYEIQVWGSEVDVCIPYIKGITPPYYPVIFNYVLPYVSGYTTEQTHDGWSITFSSTLYSSNDYTFHLEIYSRYGGALLTISSPFYNSVQYTGNIFGI
jgi:hypothetical protein